jgi:hypothetical protein
MKIKPFLTTALLMLSACSTASNISSRQARAEKLYSCQVAGMQAQSQNITPFNRRKILQQVYIACAAQNPIN